MEVIVQTEYQDVYRIRSGVLLVVNKFKLINDFAGYGISNKPYHRLTQGLRVTKEYCKTYRGNHCQKGTVTDGHSIVKLVGKDEYDFIIKTTGSDFNGDKHTMVNYLKEIEDIINSYR